jgi:hypothetical protein
MQWNAALLERVFPWQEQDFAPKVRRSLEPSTLHGKD